MTIPVELADGRRLEFPDGTDMAVIQATVKKLVGEKPQSAASRQIQADHITQAALDQTRDMSGLEKFRSGVGKAFSDLGSGAAQLVGMGPSGQEVAEQKRRDAPLMSTGAGFAGNILGNVSAALPAMFVPGANSVAGATAINAILGGLQPTETTGGKLANMALGGALGGATQQFIRNPVETLDAAKSIIAAPFKGAKALVDPFFESGREKIVGRVIRDAAGQNADDVIARMAKADEIVPGSYPTSAEAANSGGTSGGIAALQRAAAAVNPEPYATRAAQQAEARLAALSRMAGEGGRREALTAMRGEAADELYSLARLRGLDPEMSQVLIPQMKNLMERAPSGVVERARELARINGETIDKAGSLNGLHYMKKAVDDILSTAPQTGIGKEMQRGIMQFKNDLLTVMDDLSPVYGQARRTFAEMSQIPNQMETAALLQQRATNPLTGQIQPQAFARNMNDAIAQQATGNRSATLAGTMSPEQMATLQAIKDDLAASVAARDAGRGAGSDTVQKLAMANLMQRAGMPLSIMDLPGISRIGNYVYRDADARMRQRLAEVLLDPRQAARLARSVPPVQALPQIPQGALDPASLIGRVLLPGAYPMVME